MNPTGVLAVFRPHVDATIHMLKLAMANKLGAALEMAELEPSPARHLMLKGLPLRRCFSRCATR